MYNKVSTNLNFVEREKATEQFWKDNQIFEKSIKMRENSPSYTFYDGPPTANGKPHIGHVLTRVIKDMIPRYKTMKGYHEKPVGTHMVFLLSLRLKSFLGLMAKSKSSNMV